MWWLAAGLSLLSAYGSYRTSKAQSAAAAEGMQIARENAAIRKKEGEEAERRAAQEQRAIESEAKAKAYASGARGDSGNFAAVQESIITEHGKQMEWLQWSNEKAVETIIRTGEYQQMIGEAQAEASMWNAVGQIGRAAGYTYTGLNQPADPLYPDSSPFDSALTEPLISSTVPLYDPQTPFIGFNPFYSQGQIR